MIIRACVYVTQEVEEGIADIEVLLDKISTQENFDYEIDSYKDVTEEVCKNE